jgi:CBS domain-containing protein
VEVREIMGSRVCQISSSAMLSEAVDRMRALDVRALPVVEDNQIVGVVTAHDVTARAAGEGVNPGATPIRDVMTTDVACCSGEDDVEQAAGIMENSRIHWLAVLGPDHKALGVLSEADLASKTGRERFANEVSETPREPTRGTAEAARPR